MKEDKRAKQLARLEEARRRTDERLEEQRQRIDERFANIRRRIIGTDNELDADQQRIVAAALELLDEVGLHDLSLRKLAAKLDVKAPALYWHFKNKEELTDYMAEAILSHEFAGQALRTDDQSWQEWLVTACMRLRKAMLAHRDGGRVVTGAHFYPTTTLLDWFETALASLTSAGVPIEKAGLIAITVTHFTFGRTIEEQSMPSQAEIAQINKTLAHKLSESHPHVAAYRGLSGAALHADSEYETAIRLIIGNA